MNSIIIKTNVDKNSVKFFRGVVTNYLDTLNISRNIAEANETRVIISELISNVLLHAYPKNNIKPVTVILDHKEIDNKVILELTVKDEGIGMADVAKCMEPTYTTIKNEDHADLEFTLGFTILKTMANSVTVRSEVFHGTEVIITKIFNM